VVQAATIAGAHDFIQAFPQGYDTPVDQGGTNLSGGQKQRLSLARSLLRKPSILILDDATSAVDVATEARIRRALSKALPGTTIVLIAQRVSSVQDADRILILDAGGIQGSGTHQELLRENPSYQELYRSQVGEADLDLPAMEANRHG
jgi:ATP-binding cassette subfamily B protein